MLLILLLLFTAFASAKGLSCFSYYDQLSKNHTALSLAQIQSIENHILSLKNFGSDADTLWRLQNQIKSFPKVYKRLLVSDLLKNYSSLSKDRQDRNAPVAPKRSVDFLISHLMNPLDIFSNSNNPIGAYRIYLESFQSLNNDFLKPQLVLDTIAQLQRDLRKLSIKGESQFLLFGSFFNGRAKSTSDIDIMEYLEINGKSRYLETYNFLKEQNLDELEISGTYGNIKNISLDREFSLKTQPLVILLTINEAHFIIKDESSSGKQRVFSIPMSSY